MTRDVLVLGPDGLIFKTTIVLYHGGISVNSYSARDSPKPAISQLHGKKKKKKKKKKINQSISEAEALQNLFLKSLQSKVVLF